MNEPQPSRQRPVSTGDKLRVVALASLVTGLLCAAALAIDWFPVQGAASADDIDTLWDVLLLASVPVFVLVMTVAIYSCVRFRARPGETGDGPPIHGNTRLEVIWVTIPLLIVSALAVYGYVVLEDIEEAKAEEMTVEVYAAQFAWRFEYPQGGGEPVRSSELVLAKDQPVHFRIHSDDVIHSFWVPEFRLKSDAVPGITTEYRLTPDRLGSYKVVCAELCGIGHATMRQAVRVVPPAEFEDWLAERAREQSEQESGGGGGGGEQQE